MQLLIFHDLLEEMKQDFYLKILKATTLKLSENKKFKM